MIKILILGGRPLLKVPYPCEGISVVSSGSYLAENRYCSWMVVVVAAAAAEWRQKTN